MSRMRLICGILSIVIFITTEVSCDRTNKKIYIDIDGMSACFRRMNATHQVGCASQRGGNVGVLHYVQGDDDITWLQERGTHAPYAILLSATMFNESTMKALMATQKINSVMVIFSNRSDAPEAFSADLTCPNDQYGIYHGNPDYGDCKKREWNPEGNGFMFRDFPFPIVALTNQTEIDILITKCYRKFNMPSDDGMPRSYPLCSAQVKDEMNAAKDTPTCVRRSNLLQGLNPENYCDPLGNYNVFGYTRPITFDNDTHNDSVIIAAARLDGFSMFNDLYFNAEGTVSGIVALLGAAHAIGKLTLPTDHKPIMFTFFNGEAYDYIGSGRMVYDMEHGAFPTTQTVRGPEDAVSPLALSKLHSFLEVSQVGKPVSGKMWMHSDPLSATTTSRRVNEMVTTLEKAGIKAGLDIELVPAVEKQPLPSASLQSFLRRINISGIVIADHEKAYENRYYNSRFDLPSSIGAEYPKDVPQNETYNYVTPAATHIQKVASTIAKALYTISTGDVNTSHVSVDNITIANLLNCYLYRGDCELFYQLEEPGRALKQEPFTYYVGVSMSYLGPHNATRYTHRALAYFLGEKLNLSRSDCTKQDTADATQDYTYMGGPMDASGRRAGVCIRSSANTTLARSPAFDIDGYDWSSGLYSSWTESQWQVDAMKLRVFLVPSREREIMTLCVGLGLFVFSLALTFLLHKRAPVMFRPLRTSL